MTTRNAKCSCGQLRATVQGEPIRVSVCHCLACQERTGSVFGAQARFLKENVSTTGRSTAYVRTADSGKTATFHFCPECGSTVYYQLELLPEAIAIPIGAFADPTFTSPKVSIYEARMHAWVTIPGDVEHLD